MKNKISKIYRISTNVKILIFFSLIPSIITFMYFSFWASSMYIAEAKFAIRGTESFSTGSGLAAFVLPSVSSVAEDVKIVTEYIESPDIMESIDREINIFEHFSSKSYDIVSKLCENATRYDKFNYWRWAVKASLDPESGIISLKVKAYDPEKAKQLAEAVLAKSEALVNEMSRRAQDDAIKLAMREVKTAEERVSKAQESMRLFRVRSGILDPTSTAGGLQGIVSQLESEIVKVRAEIAEVSTYMSKDAPSLVGLHARHNALKNQLEAEKQRLAGDMALPDSLTSYAGEYEDLKMESEFARQQLISAMSSLENARLKAEAKSRYIVAFQIPVLPDESLYPQPILFTLYVFLGFFVTIVILILIVAAIREHAGF